MYKLTLKGLWARKLRYALTGLAVVLGVAFMAGTMVLTDTMQHTFDRAFAVANEGTDVIVRHDAVVHGEYGDVRDRVPASLVAQVAAVPGVNEARGAIQSPIRLVKADGTTSSDGLGGTIGANWITDGRLNAYSLSAGRAPAGPSEAVIDKRTAEDQGWTLGSSIKVLTKTGPATLTVVGTATYGTIDGRPDASLVATDDATAQKFFGEPDRYDSVVVAADHGVPASDLAARIGSSVGGAGSGLEAITGAQDTADKQKAFKEDLAFIDQFLMAFAYVALFVGVFIVYNTFSIVVAQRTRDLAMLRAIGARRAQVLRSVLLESTIVGVLASAAGLAAGVGLSFGLRALLSGAGVELPSGGIVVSSATVTTAFLVGVGVSVLSAFVPAVRGSRVRPMAALRDAAAERRRVSFGRIAIGLLVTGAGVASFVSGLSASGDSAVSRIGLGAMTVILGVFTLGPVLVRGGMGVLGLPTKLMGITGKYARENARRNPKRTAATASALMIGVTLVGFITIFAASTKASIAAFIDRSFRSDYVIGSGSQSQGFPTSIEDELRALPEVDVLSPVRLAPAEVDGSSVPVMAVDTAVMEHLYDLGVTAGSMASVHGGSVAVSSDTATSDHVAIGDQVPFRFADGKTISMTVAAVFDANSVGGDSNWIVGLDTFDAHVADQFDRNVFLTTDSGVPAAQSRAALEKAVAGWPQAEIQDQSEFRTSITDRIDVMLNLIYALLALAVLIALLGIANTLALSVHERRRELGLMRAIGMHRRQVRRAVRWESLLIAVFGAVLGAGLAVAGAWGLVKALEDKGITEFVVPPAQMAVIVGMAAVAGLLAARGPARRAAKVNILAAIASE
jgi:putative ABC transport system permease protein